MATVPTQQASSPAPPSPARTARRVIWGISFAVDGLLLVAIAAGGWFYWRIRACLPQLDGALAVAGLENQVGVRRDARGVPHLKASSLDDLMFAEGYVTAQDRLWQMDLSRRLARGELSEIFGKRTLALDTENRKLGFPEVAEHGIQELDPDSRQVLAAYARGVNAFISTHLDRLPIEFVLLHYRPRPWREADSIGVALNMAKSLNTSWRTDLMRERLKSKLTPELYADLFPDRDPLDHPVAEPVSGPAKAAHPDASGVLVATGSLLAPESTSALAANPAANSSLTAESPPAADADLDPTLAALTASSDEREDDPEFALGSNNWVASGAHTQSGKPLLSSDPHLGHSIPSIWYQVELEAPGLHAAGVTFPGGPVMVIGHNERIAWGMTNTGPDVQDLYLETFKPDDPNKYLVNGHWADADVRQEVIKVRGAADVHLTVRRTRHGPVIGEDGKYELALRWTALEDHALTFAFLRMARARNWQEFTEAIRHFTGPEQNMVYGDVDGNIGYYAPAWVPVRKQGDGSVPVRGDTGEGEWLGYIPFEDLPHAYNPPGGMIATANSRVVPDGYPYFITHAWAAPWRTARIFQLLEAGRNLTVDDMLRVDMDIRSLEDEDLAKELVAAGAARPPEGADAQYALEVLQSWDGEARTDSAATLVVEVTRPALLERLLRPQLGDDARRYHWSLAMTFVDNVVHNQWTRWLPPGDADFNVTLMKSLEKGVKQIPGIVGSADHSRWRWGRTIPLTFHHPLDALPLGRRLFDVGPFPQWGMATTVKATTPGAGPSMRMVVDFSDLDRSVNNLTLGESGQVSSPYYRDQFDAWYHGRSFPMLFSDAAVERGAVHRLVLEPAK
ncbi:MAG TPA: penicillin acylase family protein [Terriglobia bacterium]|nr:penicillin acylase family protein [Terriglobia bacterium]